MPVGQHYALIMATDARTLLAQAACYKCVAPNAYAVKLLQLAMMRQIALAVNPAAVVSPQGLAELAKCYKCAAPNEYSLTLMEIALLQQVVQANTPNFLVNEDFENSPVAPLGWTSNGGVDFASTTPSIFGVKSLKIPKANFAAYTFTATQGAQPEVWLKFIFRCDTGFPAANSHLVSGFDIANSIQLFDVVLTSTGNLLANPTGGTPLTTVAAMAANTVYTVWVHYKAGSGNDSQLGVWFSPNNTKPADISNNAVLSTVGTSTLALSSFRFQPGGTVPTFYTVDNVQAAATLFS